jgi:hypothetical protein
MRCTSPIPLHSTLFLFETRTLSENQPNLQGILFHRNAFPLQLTSFSPVYSASFIVVMESLPYGVGMVSYDYPLDADDVL